MMLSRPSAVSPVTRLNHDGVDDPGADGVDADVRPRVVQRGGLREANHGVLRSDVRGSAGEADDAGTGGGVHDGAAAVPQHQRDLVLHAEEYAPDVDGEDPVALLLADVGRRLGRLFDAGVVERDVDAPEPVDRLRQSRVDIGALGDIAAYGDDPPAVCLDQAGRFGVGLLVDVGDHHAGALTRERQRGSAADTCAGSSDEGDLVGEASLLVGHRISFS
jgi:hypothetical protein